MTASTLFFATLLSSLFALTTAGSAITVTPLTGLVQCANATIKWSGGAAPFNVFCYTGCSDPNDNPIASWYNMPTSSAEWYVNVPSGTDVFCEVTDATGDDAFTPDAYVGGNSGQDETTCTQHIKDANLGTTSYTYTAPAGTDSTDSTGTPATPPASDGSIDAGTVANAGTNSDGTDNGDSGNTSQPPTVGGSLASAGVIVVPSLGLGVTLIGAGLLALF